jgi:hypothetical protein
MQSVEGRQQTACCLFPAGFLLGLLLNHEDKTVTAAKQTQEWKF